MQWDFGPFRLDLANACLWQGEQRLTLRPKTFDILVYLVEHAGELVTKEALLDAIWPDTVVAEGVLTTGMGELRKILGETARQPQFIATVHRRGYRFIAPVTASNPLEVSTTPQDPGDTPDLSSAYPDSVFSQPMSALVDREAELTQLGQWFTAACQGQRQVVLMSGEAGIGKTTLVDAFLAQFTSQEEPLWVGRGQCIDHYGAGEPYLPLLEALGNVGQAPDGAQVVAVLHQHAPSWLLQLPALVPADAFDRLQQRAQGGTRERMLRELAEAVETLANVHPLILVLEDLHWSDVSTLDWLAYVARRRALARLLILGTYRPVDAMVRNHPVRTVTQELGLHGQCVELTLDYLSEAGVAAYLAWRFETVPLAQELVRSLHQRTNGNPLFLVAMVDALVQQGMFRKGAAGRELSDELKAVEIGIPEGLRQLITQQLERLPETAQGLLEAGSVAGKEFTTEAAAACLDRDTEVVEDQCTALVRREQFLRACGTEAWPDGTVSARFAFIHDLYREIAYERAPVGRRMRWHLQIGSRLETGYGAQASTIAAELAEHFLRGGDDTRAVRYLHHAGEQALRRNAHQETITQLTKALEILHGLPDTAEHARYELDVRTALGPAYSATKGYAAPEVEQTYRRAQELSQQLQDNLQLFLALRGLWNCRLMRTEVQTARTLGEQLFRLASGEAIPALLVEARRALGTTLFFQGELATARRHLEDGIALYDRQQHQALAVHYGADPGVTCRVYAARTLWLLGYPDQALQRGHDTLRLAHELGHPFSLGFALTFLTDLFLMRREGQAAQAQNEAVWTLVRDHGFPHWVAIALINEGWSLIEQGQWDAGIKQMSQGMAAWQDTGAALERPQSLAVLGAAYGHVGRVEEGLACMAEALTMIQQTGECWWEAEVCRLQGELLRKATDREPKSVLTPEMCFQKALEVARRQQAKSLELRTAISLSRLRIQQDQRDDVYPALAGVYHWFTEGFDTLDLQEARALLDELER